MIENKLSQTGNTNLPTSVRYDTGLWPDRNTDLVPLWRTGYNVLFKNGGVEKMKGWANPLTKPNTQKARGVHQQRFSNGIQVLVWGSYDALWVWDTTQVRWLQSGLGGRNDSTATQKATVWSFAEWGDWILYTSGEGAIRYTTKDNYTSGDGSASTPLDVEGEFSTAQIIIKRGPYILAFNTTGTPSYCGPTSFHWCSDDDVTAWSPTADNTAGNQLIRDMESEIIAAVALGDRIAVYSRDSMHIVAYTGPPFYFGYAPAINGIGAVSKQAVVSVGRENYGFGPNGIWRTDGAQFKYIDEGIHDYIYEDLNIAQDAKVCGYHDEFNTMVNFYYPTAGSSEPDVGVGYNYTNGTWTIYNHGRTACIERQVFDYPIAVTDTNDVYFHNFGLNADSAELLSYLESVPLDLGDSNTWKYIDAIKFQASRMSGNYVRFILGTTERRDRSSLNWGAANFLGDGEEPVYINDSARYIVLRIDTLGLSTDFKLDGHTIFGEGATGQS